MKAGDFVKFKDEPGIILDNLGRNQFRICKLKAPHIVRGPAEPFVPAPAEKKKLRDLFTFLGEK